MCGPEVVHVEDSTSEAKVATVELRVVANQKGKVIFAKPISGDPDFYEEAVALIKQRKFRPKVISGRRVKTEMIIKYVFTAKSNIPRL